MAARYTEAPVITTMQYPRHVSFEDLEIGLIDLAQQVAERKQQLSCVFAQIHQIVEERENTLFAELDTILAEITAKIHERSTIMEKLTKNRDDTERELNANRLNALLQKNLKNIKEEMEKIFLEQIVFPRASISCQTEEIERILEEKCRILKPLNPYGFRTLPIWSRVKEGEEIDQLSKPSAICIDPISQLIYVGEDSVHGRIQVFTSEGKHYFTLHNPLMEQCRYMKIHKYRIYMTTSGTKNYFLKLNKRAETIKTLTLDTPVYGISIEGSNIYTCAYNSLAVQIFDLSLEPTKKVILEAISFDKDTTPRDIILHRQQMFVLFSYYGNNYHPDPIQVFKLDGTLIRTLITGNFIDYGSYFCLDSYENILVSDCEGHCIRIISPDGILMQSIGRMGMNKAGELWNPNGIIVDSKHNIIIVDWKDDNLLQAF